MPIASRPESTEDKLEHILDRLEGALDRTERKIANRTFLSGQEDATAPTTETPKD